MISYVEETSDPYQSEQTSSAFLGKSHKYRSVLGTAKVVEPAISNREWGEHPVKQNEEASGNANDEELNNLNLI